MVKEFVVEITVKKAYLMCYEDEAAASVTLEQVKRETKAEIEQMSYRELGEWLASAKIEIGEPKEVHNERI